MTISHSHAPDAIDGGYRDQIVPGPGDPHGERDLNDEQAGSPIADVPCVPEAPLVGAYAVTGASWHGYPPCLCPPELLEPCPYDLQCLKPLHDLATPETRWRAAWETWAQGRGA